MKTSVLYIHTSIPWCQNSTLPAAIVAVSPCSAASAENQTEFQSFTTIIGVYFISKKREKNQFSFMKMRQTYSFNFIFSRSNKKNRVKLLLPAFNSLILKCYRQAFFAKILRFIVKLLVVFFWSHSILMKNANQGHSLIQPLSPREIEVSHRDKG